MSRKYTDFDLWVYPDPPRAVFRVQARVAGRVETGKIERPFDEMDLGSLRNTVANGRSRDIEVRKAARVSARDLGRKLFEAVFTGSVRDLLNAFLPGFASRRGLRLRLHLSGEAARWPWELLHTPKRFLALSDRTPVVRHLDYDKPLPPLWTPLPLRVLVVIASPRGYPALDGEQELKEIREALGWLLRLGLVKIERLDPPTLEALVDCLDRKRFHVLHFIGHGGFDGRRGALFFQNTEGGADRVEGERLAAVASDNSSLRLVVLNACEGAAATAQELFAGVAQSVAGQGIPAVAAMQFPISDPMAVMFAHRFYGALARGRVVDSAATKARRAMYAAGGLAWAIPVLFLSSRNGRLFRWRPSWGSVFAIAAMLALLLAYWTWQGALVPIPLVTPTATPCSPLAELNMDLVRIPAGHFMMGFASGEKDEEPLHEVTISQSFCLGKYEVTQEQWESVMGANSLPNRRPGTNLPVSSVSWEEVQEYIKRVQAGLGPETVVRLPTEAEWEYAARGPGGLPAGSNCLYEGVDGPSQVGSLRPNRWGLYDMHGNVWEWVQDWYGSYQPQRAVDPKGPETGARRVRRGGSYDSAISNCRPERRNSLETDSRFKNVGFRLLWELAPPS